MTAPIAEQLPPTLKRSIIAGTWRFTAVALLGFAPWALAGGFFIAASVKLDYMSHA